MRVDGKLCVGCSGGAALDVGGGRGVDAGAAEVVVTGRLVAAGAGLGVLAGPVGRDIWCSNTEPRIATVPRASSTRATSSAVRVRPPRRPCPLSVFSIFGPPGGSPDPPSNVGLTFIAATVGAPLI